MLVQGFAPFFTRLDELLAEEAPTREEYAAMSMELEEWFILPLAMPSRSRTASGADT